MQSSVALVLLVASRLAVARRAFLDVVDFIVVRGRTDPNAVYSGSVPYLMLGGNLVASWQFGRALLAAQSKLAVGDDVEFMCQKIASRTSTSSTC